MAVLELDRVTKRFGALAANEDVSFSIEAGERVALVGPNGAGKTTLFNLISGELPLTSGKVELDGNEVTKHSPEKMVSAGLGRTFQRNSHFEEKTVFENVRLAVQARMPMRARFFRSVEKYPELRSGTEKVLEQVNLSERGDVLASELSYGEQRQLEIGMALATSPKVLLLDEPTAGMSTSETNEVVELLGSLPEDITLLIVEHDMDVVTALAKRIIVLNFGKTIADGTPEEVRENEEVLAAYLGAGLDDEEEEGASDA
ncbi:MAG: ABC transporter ATP-binding protein [Rubrobacteraceae bacterium]|jgi:branched-chain amino acid transport system ATP-binding protein